MRAILIYRELQFHRNVSQCLPNSMWKTCVRTSCDLSKSIERAYLLVVEHKLFFLSFHSSWLYFFLAAQFLTICLYNFLMKNHRRWSWRGSGEWFLKANFEVNRKTLSPSCGKQEKLWATWKGNSRRQKANKNKCGEEEKPSCARDDSFVFCCRHFYWFDSSNKNMS